jgi:rSAM/selenodomain-associated transferase 2
VEIAVVIPALDEAAQIAGAIASAQAPDPASKAGVDIVVVDGGSRDDTADLARAAGARVLESERGRARQLEVGWRATTSDVVVFLHADSRLVPGWARAIRDRMEDESVAGGAFRFRFDERSPGLRGIEWGARLRARVFGLAYGDQGLFVRRRVLESIGGIPATPVMEDVDLVAAIRGQGRLALLDLPVITSARRYRTHGVLRTWGRHAVALLGWRLGVDRDRIAEWVRR